MDGAGRWKARSQDFSIGGDSWDRSKPNNVYSCGSGPLSSNLFGLGSLYATLVCINQKQVCVAVLQCTSLKSALQYLDCAPVDEISLPDSKYNISGQILSLLPVSISSPSGTPTSSWVWNSKFVVLNTAKSYTTQPTSITWLCHLSIPVNSCLVYPFLSSKFTSTLTDTLHLASDLIWKRLG